MTKRIACLISLLLLYSVEASALGIPKLRGYVNDYANMISGSSKAKLEEELKSFEQSDSTQLVILTIPSLEGEPIEDYSIKVVEAWKLGQARKDNGILLLVSKNDRKIRIEVGRGFEGRLTDLMAGRIIDLVIKPRFKRDDFDGGFTAGVASLIDATRGEFQGEQKDSREASQPFGSSWLFLGIIILLFIIFSFARRRGKLGNASSGGLFVLPSGRGGKGGFGSGGGIFGGGGTFGGGGGGTFGGGGASGSW